MWIRKCQECGHKQPMKSPKGQSTENWRNAQCRKCNSPALDYGQEIDIADLGPIADAIRAKKNRKVLL